MRDVNIEGIIEMAASSIETCASITEGKNLWERLEKIIQYTIIEYENSNESIS